jgi:hypothetical protein
MLYHDTFCSFSFKDCGFSIVLSGLLISGIRGARRKRDDRRSTNVPRAPIFSTLDICRFLSRLP